MNPADVQRFSEQAADVNEALHAGEIVIGGQPYAAAVGNPPLEGAVVLGGEVFSGQLLIRLRKAVHPAEPARDLRLLAQGREWVVRRVTGQGLDACWTLSCEPHN